MSETPKFTCIYQKPGYALCVNPNCHRPGIICQNGYNTKGECNMFHEGCDKMLWEKVQSLIYRNPSLRSPEFQYLQEKVDGLFIGLINKIKTEHTKFRMWVKTYGYSMEVMKFIGNITEQNYTQLTGNYFSPILNEMTTTKKIEIPKIV